MYTWYLRQTNQVMALTLSQVRYNILTIEFLIIVYNWSTVVRKQRSRQDESVERRSLANYGSIID